MNLFQLNKEFREAVKRVDFFATENDGIVNEELELELNILELAREEKALNIAGYIKELEADAEMIKREENNLRKMREAKENKSEWLKKYLHKNINEGEKLESPWAKISWRKSKSVEILDEKIIDRKYILMEPKILKACIGDDLKAGIAVEGAILKEKMNLQIK